MTQRRYSSISSSRTSSARHKRNPLGPSARWRLLLVRSTLVLGLCALIGRIVWLQVLDHDFLQGQGDARTIRTETVSANRGVIMDREGEPLAVSTPVVTLIGNPREMSMEKQDLIALGKALEEPSLSTFISRMTDLHARNKSFVYLARRITADKAQNVQDLHLSGIEARNEYKRYYPAGEVASQLVGITDINDEGSEGLERAYNGVLRGVTGERKVIKDRRGNWVRDMPLFFKDASPGQDIQLSINLRLQYLAYRELLNTVQEHDADAGSILIMNARTGEVLAEASVPSYNPNNINGGVERNRPITDAMEPGSVMKPLAMSAFLENGQFPSNMTIDTSPGYMPLDQFTIRDVRNFGVLTLTGIITKSSNIGMTKLALMSPNDTLWKMYNRMGLSHAPATGFPGESSGSLPDPSRLISKSTRATMAYGYGVAVSPLQLASAYTTIANDGRYLRPSLLKLPAAPQGEQLIAPKTAHQVLEMMETVVGPYGGGGKAAIEGYRVSGKTGTVRKIKAGAYEAHAFRSNFVGIVPATNPRLIAVISIDNSKQGGYYGGAVAAPLFARIAGPALRMLDVPPDDKRDDGDSLRHADDAIKVTGIRQQGAAEAAARSTPND